MSEPKPSRLTEQEQEQEFQKSRVRRGTLVTAIHHLEERLSSAAPGREKPWVQGMIDALAELRAVMRDRLDTSDGLLRDIEAAAPHLWNQVQKLRTEYAHIERQAGDLIAEFHSPDEGHCAEYRDVRQRVGWLLTALRHEQSRETDLIFKVYNRDMGGGG